MPDYLRLLELGGSVGAGEAVAALGLDVRDRALWRKGFREVGRLIEAVIADS